ncbi:polysaccharide deacetylase family protein [Psychrosphaera sp. B3R10]|uniref:polysaccharide deacetylase family protein n=1 Tax=unclassified Psychrosphaera TaxID=2641570 RepID=UPI001C0968F2|nr:MULTISPECIES: polysaccharide deacetylase family protein [unclassified Psychrosphaera]MBU2883726.1 polysaccharide deacetylase family protein [Psychrosphaera sp. I2R16]MBU2987972.1 polysaccharide deacetylase family protein [Psychrosphaera sp. B3R10]
MLSWGLNILAWINFRKHREYPLAVLYFHRVLDKADPFCPDDLDVASFEQLIAALSKHFTIYPLSKALALQKKGKLPKLALALTFDDGYLDNYTNALPILEKYNIKASFFVATNGTQQGWLWNDQLETCLRNAALANLDFENQHYSLATEQARAKTYLTLVSKIKFLPNALRDKAVDTIVGLCGDPVVERCMMTESQLKSLVSRGHDVGAHTASHSILGFQNDAVAEEEISTSIRYLNNVLGTTTTIFAYPNGWFDRDFSNKHASMVKKCGVEYAVATNDGGIVQTSNNLALPRFMPYRKKITPFCLSLEKIAGEVTINE